VYICWFTFVTIQPQFTTMATALFPRVKKLRARHLSANYPHLCRDKYWVELHLYPPPASPVFYGIHKGPFLILNRSLIFQGLQQLMQK